jgi:hypothetical protein
VAAFVGELRKSMEVEDSNVTVYTSEDYLTQTGYVMEETPELFTTMVNYTEIPIEANKMEFLSVPDFNGESTENWGLNTYRFASNSHCCFVLCPYCNNYISFFSYSRVMQGEVHVDRRRFKNKIQRAINNDHPTTK